MIVEARFRHGGGEPSAFGVGLMAQLMPLVFEIIVLEVLIYSPPHLASSRFLANDDALKHFVRIWSDIDGHKELTRSSGNVHEHRNSEKSVRNVLLAHELSAFAFFLPGNRCEGSPEGD